MATIFGSGAGVSFSACFASASAVVNSRCSIFTVSERAQRLPSQTEELTCSGLSLATTITNLAPAHAKCDNQYSSTVCPSKRRLQSGPASDNSGTEARCDGQINNAFT